MVTALLSAPRDAHASEVAEFYTAVVGAIFLIGALWCLWTGARERSWVPPVVLLSGALTVLCEPIVDNLGAVWYPTDNPLIVWTSMGVPQPLFLFLGYPLFWGAVVYLWVRLLASGRVSVWPLFWGVVVLDLFVELLGVWILDVGIYYGPAPMRVAGFPLWWAPVNATVAVVAARIFLHLLPLVRGWRVIALLSVSPMAFVGTHAICAWPVWVTMHSDVPDAVRWGAACLTIGFAVAVTGFVATTMPDRDAAAPSPSDPAASKVQPQPLEMVS